MIVFPNCKINIGLNILNKRPDGFHNLETIFYPLRLCDCLEIIPADDKINSFSVTGIDLPADYQKNLCEKAYDLLRKDHELPPVKMHLHKKVPIGAGLGGGSADAAFTLTLLNSMFQMGLTEDELMMKAAALGSDCAFFIKNKPSLGSGRGEILSDVELSLKPYKLVVIVPPIHVSTREAFSGITPSIPAAGVSHLIKKPLAEWRNVLNNDFEPGIFSICSRIQQIKQSMYDHGAIYASMSGSGSAVFGIFDGDVSAALTAEYPDCFVWQENPDW